MTVSSCFLAPQRKTEKVAVFCVSLAKMTFSDVSRTLNYNKNCNKNPPHRKFLECWCHHKHLQVKFLYVTLVLLAVITPIGLQNRSFHNLCYASVNSRALQRGCWLWITVIMGTRKKTKIKQTPERRAVRDGGLQPSVE